MLDILPIPMDYVLASNLNPPPLLLLLLLFFFFFSPSSSPTSASSCYCLLVLPRSLVPFYLELRVNKMSRSCGTCRDRRISCDRTAPICLQCAHSNRVCQGYGIRLSWPKPKDRRRAMVGKPSLKSEGTAQPSAHVRLVNFSTFDMNLHHHLTGSNSCHSAQLTLRSPMPFNPSHLDIAEKDLLQYFRCIASRSLTTFTHDPVDLGNIIMHLTLLNDSPSAAAVLRSLLALSSVHRDGLQSQAAGLKISALKALIAAPKHDITAIEAAQHVAAGMLLCSFEIHRASCTSDQWMTYLIGAKRIIKASSLESSGEFGPLIDWVHYHDVLSRFSNIHWRPKIVDVDSPSSESSAETLSLSPGMSSVHNTPLALLSDICDAVSAFLPDIMLTDDRDDHQAFLKTLAFRIRNISSTEISPSNSRSRTMTALFQCAMLVYLNRASLDLLEPAAETERRIQNAFATFTQLDACERQFPLFILGCEARTDHERSIVLDLITRTEEHASSRSLYLVRKMIEAIWIQDDLAKGEINYTNKLTAIISCCAILPTFV